MAQRCFQWREKLFSMAHPFRVSYTPGMSETMTLAIAGCGARGRTYARLAHELGADRYQVVAAADHKEASLKEISPWCVPDAQFFTSVEEMLDAPRLAETMVIATQDQHHHGHALAALDKGYHLLLEKPVGCTAEECRDIYERARERKRRIVVCFVLRYTPLFQTMREVVDSGAIGRLITMEHVEGVEPFHQAHSFVRGHWSKPEESTPMIVAKCCHDTDLLTWFAGAPFESVASAGDLTWFREENAPEGAPARCTDGCPHSPGCRYDAHRYLRDKKNWLDMVLPGASRKGDDEILDFLLTSPWGRCAWRCDNGAVDHQVLAIRFQNGVTATITMTAFEQGRRLRLMGTEGVLECAPDPEGGSALWLRSHDQAKAERVPIKEPERSGYAGHGGGDFGLIDSLSTLIRGDQEPGTDSLASHLLAFGAEEARVCGEVVRG